MSKIRRFKNHILPFIIFSMLFIVSLPSAEAYFNPIGTYMPGYYGFPVVSSFVPLNYFGWYGSQIPIFNYFPLPYLPLSRSSSVLFTLGAGGSIIPPTVTVVSGAIAPTLPTVAITPTATTTVLPAATTALLLGGVTSPTTLLVLGI